MREVTSIEDILKIVPIEVDVMSREPGDAKMPLKDKLTWIDAMLNRKRLTVAQDFKILVWEDDAGQIDAYLMLSLLKSSLKHFSEVRIYRAWRNPDRPELAQEMWDAVSGWAKANKIDKIRAEVNMDRPDGFVKKYGLKPVSVNTERRLGNG
jgi:hypothetical protein